MREEWRVCRSSPAYSVSSLGRVRDDSTGAILIPRFRHGAPVVWGRHMGQCRPPRVAALVAEAFCGLPSVYSLRTTHRITHRNDNPADNRPANLRVLSRNIRSSRDLELAEALHEVGFTRKIAQRLTGVSAKLLRRRQPPPGV